jgi:hypothetical protein
MEWVWKNLLRRYLSPPNRRKIRLFVFALFEKSRCLELAKGFEPPTP